MLLRKKRNMVYWYNLKIYGWFTIIWVFFCKVHLSLPASQSFPGARVSLHTSKQISMIALPLYTMVGTSNPLMTTFKFMWRWKGKRSGGFTVSLIWLKQYDNLLRFTVWRKKIALFLLSHICWQSGVWSRRFIRQVAPVSHETCLLISLLNFFFVP